MSDLGGPGEFERELEIIDRLRSADGVYMKGPLIARLVGLLTRMNTTSYATWIALEEIAESGALSKRTLGMVEQSNTWNAVQLDDLVNDLGDLVGVPRAKSDG